VGGEFVDVSAAGAGSGTKILTFLIADIRGYTAFTRQHGDAQAARLAKKFADLARDAVEARGGHVIELRGDEALAVFDSSAQAVRAALEFQATCFEETEDDPALPLTVGIGIDTGEAVPVEDGFRGVALNTAARLCSKAQAGQVFVTRAVAEAVGAVDGLRFEERGTAELKGFEQPVELVEAIAPEPRAAAKGPAPSRRGFPPELDPLTPLVDREGELRWLRGTWRQVRRGAGRIVFVSGPPGIGKTRLAAALAAEAIAGEASVAYAGAGGSAMADTMAAIRAVALATHPTLVVLDDLDAVADAAAEALAAVLNDVAARPILVVGLLRNPDTAPELTTLVDRADVNGDGHRSLGPLDAHGVRDIARLYVGENTEDLPLESMARASGGVPARVHEVVSDWARQEASRRLTAAAEWLAAGREKRASDLEFANNVIGLKLGRLYAGEARTADGLVCPYKGLAAFEESDAADFFGRERLVGEMAARLVQVGLLGVVGSSGSGKSSLVFAGVFPSLRAGILPGSDRWRHASMRPGEHPMRELRAAVGSPLGSALEDLQPSERLVLVVDQFEEIFTQCADVDERASFVDVLTHSAVESPDRVAVVVTIRGDFYARCAEYEDLARLLAANHVLVGAMGRDELRRAVELPARRAGLRVESALVDELVEEVADEPGGLPLLSTALVELWQARTDGWLRLDVYEKTGGVRGAVARLAESAFENLDTPQREAARAIFLRLIATGEREAVTRRRVPISEFDVDRNPVTASVLTRLTGDRLLTRSDSSVEVAHEALLREWPRLQAWLQEDAQGRLLRQQITQVAKQWADSGNELSELYRGARLSAALDWAALHGRELNELEREFLAASREAGEREAERQRRTNRRLRGLLVGVALFLLVALVAGVLALVQRSNAQDAATRAQQAATAADAQRLGAQAQVQKDLDLSLLLAREGLDLDDSVATRSNLLAALLRSPSAIRVMHPMPGRLTDVQITTDGTTLLVSNNAGRFALVDATTGTVRDGFPGVIASLSSDGTRAAVLDADGTILIRDLATGRTRNLGKLPSAVVEQGVNPAFAPDLGRVLLVYSPKGTGPAHAFLFDMASLKPVAQIASPRGTPDGAIFSPDGRYIGMTSNLGTTDQSPRLVTVWRNDDLRHPVLSARTSHPLHATAISHDDSMFALGAGDGSVMTVSIPGGLVHVFNGRHNAEVQRVGFTPDDRTIVSTGDDGQVLVWDARTGELRETLAGENGRIFGPAFSPDGKTVYTGGLDGSLFAWDLSGERRLGRIFQATSAPPSGGAGYPMAASPDGRFLAFEEFDGTDATLVLRDARTLGVLRTIALGQGEGFVVTFSPDSKLIATETHLGGHDADNGKGYDIALWNADTGERVGTFHGPPPHVVVSGTRYWNDVEALAFSSDGKSLLGGDDRGLVYVWNVATRRLIGSPLAVPPDPKIGFNPVFGVAESPDGRLLAAAHGENATVWSLPQRRALYTVNVDDGYGRSKTVAFSPDGRLLVTGGGTGVVEFWNARTGRPSPATPGGSFGKSFVANDCWLDTLQFTPDGKTLLASGCDGAARLYDVSTRQEIGTPLQGPGNIHNESTLSADGRRVVVYYDSGLGYVWDVSPRSWAARACSVAGRNLTPSEWEHFLPDRPYRKVCSS
jgi:WD40 repeat protein/class 3 adenylate cyclase